MTDPDENGNFDISAAALYINPKTGKIDHDKVQRLFLTPQFVQWNAQCQPTLPRRAIAVGLGHYHILVAARDGGALESQVYASGLNNDGQLGLGHKNTCHALTHVSVFISPHNHRRYPNPQYNVNKSHIRSLCVIFE
jgi:alpha-tubulin suppressor-like RCC1 family protein